MKKVLVLMLVLGIASLANATLTLVGDAADPTIVYVVGTDNPDGAAAFMTSTGDVDAGTILYGGSLSSIDDITGDADLTPLFEDVLGESITTLYMLGFFDGSATPLPADGDLAKFVTTSGTVYLHDPETAEVIASYQVPEPMTMAILGLGGLFLRRKK